MVKNLLNLFGCFLPYFFSTVSDTPWTPSPLYDFRKIRTKWATQRTLVTETWNKASLEQKQKICECIFFFCVAWSVGTVLDQKSRSLFDHLLRKQTSTPWPEVKQSFK